MPFNSSPEFPTSDGMSDEEVTGPAPSGTSPGRTGKNCARG